MYLYEDRIRAVKLYIKLGKRTGPIIRKLVYPTKNSLKGWHRELERSLDLQADYPPQGGQTSAESGRWSRLSTMPYCSAQIFISRSGVSALACGNQIDAGI